MIHEEAVERAALAFQEMLGWPKTSPHAVYVEKATEILVASGYPAALTEATEVIRGLERALRRALRAGDSDEAWRANPYLVRARVWLTDHETTT